MYDYDLVVVRSSSTSGTCSPPTPSSSYTAGRQGVTEGFRSVTELTED
jgi:hypothetical protein